MKRILTGFLLLFLVACTAPQPEQGNVPAPGFTFSANPSTGMVSVESSGSALMVQAEGERRTLVPGDELELTSFDYAFVPGNMLIIDAEFKNISSLTFHNLAFLASPSSDNLVSSTEPTVANTMLEPGESTGSLRFEVMHKGQAFSYVVDAEASVEEPDETGSETECTDPFEIPSRFVREGIRIQLGLAEDSEITCEDMVKLETLDFFELREEIDPESPEWVAIGNLEGLQYAENLKRLTLPIGLNKEIAQPLEGLTSLTELAIEIAWIDDVDITYPEDYKDYLDLTPLGTLTNLTYFKIDAYQANFGWIDNLENLRQLDLSNNMFIEDLTQFTVLEELTALDVSNNSIKDISPLQTLSNLEQLNISANPIENLNLIASFSTLTGLALDSLEISDLTLIQGLTQLVELSLELNDIVDLSPLAGLTDLKVLNLWGNEISDVSPLSGLVNLTELDLGSNELSVVAPLGNLTNLRKLSFYGNQVNDLSALSNLTALVELSLGLNGLDNIEALSTLTALERLSLYNNKVADLTPLKNHENLVRLSLGRNPIRDIRPLASNENVGDGEDVISLVYTCLDMSTGSSAIEDINIIEARNPEKVNVYYGGTDSRCGSSW